MGHRKKPQATDAFDRPDETDIQPSAFQAADDLVGAAA
jgi:hypothetical protein